MSEVQFEGKEGEIPFCRVKAFQIKSIVLLIISVLMTFLLVGCNIPEKIDNNKEPQQQEFNGYTDEELLEMARVYCELNNHYVPSIIEIDSKNGNEVVIHLYDIGREATNTIDWYTVDRYTAKGTNLFGEDIDLTEK